VGGGVQPNSNPEIEINKITYILDMMISKVLAEISQ
jgi:hypothetical protein